MTIRGPFAVTLLVAAFVSLAANLLIAGFTVARFSDMGPPGGDEIDRIVSLGIHDFPPEIQRDILAEVRVNRGQIEDDINAIHGAERTMFEAMRADPFDRTSLDAAFADVRSTTSDVQTIGQNIVGRAIAGSPPAVRAQIRERHGAFP
jgi:hypothetical protein